MVIRIRSCFAVVCLFSPSSGVIVSLLSSIMEFAGGLILFVISFLSLVVSLYRVKVCTVSRNNGDWKGLYQTCTLSMHLCWVVLCEVNLWLSLTIFLLARVSILAMQRLLLLPSGGGLESCVSRASTLFFPGRSCFWPCCWVIFCSVFWSIMYGRTWWMVFVVLERCACVDFIFLEKGFSCPASCINSD